MLKEVFSFDRSRTTRRREIRAELADIELRRQRADELAQEIAELDERCDRAADLHARRCEPIQRELAAVEDAIRDAITDRKKVAKGDESRRVELLEEIAAANEDLERETSLVKSLRKPLAKERQECQMANAKSQALENQLADEEHGEPGLLDERFVAKSASDWLHHRRRAAEQALGKVEAHLREIKAHDEATGGRLGYAAEIAATEKKVRRWNLEIEAVVEQQQHAERELRRIREALISE